MTGETSEPAPDRLQLGEPPANLRMRLARRHANMSQSALAARVGVRRSAVSHWESNGGKSPSTKHLCQVALVTHVEFEWLATGRGQMAISDDTLLASVPAADVLVAHDPLEQRVLTALRRAPLRTRLVLAEMAELLVGQAGAKPLVRR